MATRVYWILILLFAVTLFMHWIFPGTLAGSLSHEREYVYEQSVLLKSAPGEFGLVMHIPAAGENLQILEEQFQTADLKLDTEVDDLGRRMALTGSALPEERRVRYLARLTAVPVRYEISAEADWSKFVAPDSLNLASTELVQTGDPLLVAQLARILDLPAAETQLEDMVNWRPQDWLKVLQRLQVAPQDAVTALYEYCHLTIQPANFSGTTDALTTLRLQEASCGGKSRLFAGMTRTLGIPSRLVGGCILGKGGTKRAHHIWVELKIAESWVPFDPLNGHFAFLPENFLVLYRGDHPLIRHSRGLSFDYRFLTRQVDIPSVWAGKATAQQVNYDPGTERTKTLIPLLGRTYFSAILLAPFALMFIVFARQVIGMESIGTFLPILLGFSILQTGWFVGGIQIFFCLLLGVVMRMLLVRLNLLHVPRTAIMITFVVLFYLVFSLFLEKLGFEGGVNSVILPLAALAMTVEKFTLVAMDRGTRTAVILLLQTFVLAAGCYFLMATTFFQVLTVAFPEILLVVIAQIIVIGHYRGLRLKELWRFRSLLGRSRT